MPPLQRGKSANVITKNIQTGTAAGATRRQAIAAALATARKSSGNRPAPAKTKGKR
jgi:hypothetical protein